jgi:hypothetical protein
MQSENMRESRTNETVNGSWQIAYRGLAALRSALSSALDRFGDLVLGIRVGVLLDDYTAAGCPDRYLKERPKETRDAELRHVALLHPFWARIRVRRISVAKCYQYYHWRVPQLSRGKGGGRTVELELNTLRNALRHGERSGRILFYPKINWPGFCPEDSIRHCRESMPEDITEVHTLAKEFFVGSSRSQVLGFLTLFLANTGLRPHEAPLLRVDAGPGEPGYITPDGKLLRVLRGKRQAKVNPWVPITEELAELLRALHRWRKKNHPKSLWYFPSPIDPTKPVGRNSLTRALTRLFGRRNEEG